MLGKLIKHEFRAVISYILPLYLGMFILSVVCRLINELYNSMSDVTLFNIISTIITLLFTISLYLCGFMTIILVIKRFHSSLFSDQGYLYMTLPVSVHAHIISKLIVAIVSLLLATVTLSVSLLVVFLNKNLWGVLWDKISYLASAFGDLLANNPAETVMVILLFLLGSINAFLLFYMSDAIGSMFNKHKILIAVAVFFGINIFVSIASSYLFVGLDNYSTLNTPLSYLILMNLFVAVLDAVFYFITAYILKNKLNLE